MIGSLRGKLVHRDPPHLVLEVAGVGYEIEVPMSTWSRLPQPGEEVHLRTHLIVREDQHQLFGFATEAERRLFRDLLRVSGVGGRIALGILSGISVEGFVRCVQSRDIAALTQVPGVGRKTAERLIVELRDRIEEMAAGGITGPGSVAPAGATAPETEVLDALVALGYKPAEARAMVERARPHSESTAELLRAALKTAAPQNRGA